jgi:hypothetical protein
MGDWKVISTAGTGSIPTVPDAPNVLNTGGTLTTVTVVYGLIGNASAYQFTGSISLDMGNANIAHLKKIHVVYSITGREIATLLQPNGGWSSSPVPFSSEGYFQDAAAHTGTLKFECENEDANQTAGAVTVSVTVQASTVTSITSASEVGPVTTDPTNRLVSTKISFVPVFNGGQVPQSCTFAVSADNGVSYIHIGAERINTVGQAITVIRLSPGATANWKVAACAGWLQGDPSVPILAADLAAAYPGCVVSASFSVAGLALPSATAVTSASVGAFINRIRNDGTQYGEIGVVTYTDPTDASFFVRITVDLLDSSHTSLAAGGGEKVHAGTQVAGLGGTVRSTANPLLFSYITGLTYVRYKIYLANRNSQNAGDFSDPTTNKLETCWVSAADHYDVAITIPPGAIDARQLAPDTLGAGIAPDSSGKPTPTGDGSGNLMSNSTFEFGSWITPKDWTPQVTVATGTTSYFVGTNPAAARTGVQYWAMLTGVGGKIEIYQKVPVKPNTQYFVSQWWQNLGTDGAASLYVAFYEGDGTTFISSSTVASVSGATGAVYVQIKGTITTPANCSVMLVDGFVVGSTNYWLLDDVVCQKQVTAGSGATTDGLGGVAVNTGIGLQISGGFLTVKPFTGLTVDASGVYVPAGGITNSLLAALSVATAQIQAGAVGATQIANASITTAKIGAAQITTALIANLAVTNALIANLAVGDANIISLSASKITVGTLVAGISITSPTINGGSLTITTATSTVTIQPSSSGMACISSPSSANYDAIGVGLSGSGGAASFGWNAISFALGGVVSTTLSYNGLKVQNFQVISTRVFSTPSTLADVIAVLQHHGLSN